MEWPQSGERLRGREKMREFQEDHSRSRPSWRPLGRDGLWVVEGSSNTVMGGKMTSCSRPLRLLLQAHRRRLSHEDRHDRQLIQLLTAYSIQLSRRR